MGIGLRRIVRYHRLRRCLLGRKRARRKRRPRDLRLRARGERLATLRGIRANLQEWPNAHQTSVAPGDLRALGLRQYVELSLDGDGGADSEAHSARQVD